MAGPGGWMTSGVAFLDAEPSHPSLHCFRYGLDDQQIETIPLHSFSGGAEFYDSAGYKPRSIFVLESQGGESVGIQATKSFVTTICTKWRIPASFFERMISPGSLPRFEYLFERSKPSSTPKTQLDAINLGFRWGTGNANYIVAFGRYDVAESTLMIFLSSRDILDYKPLDVMMRCFHFSSVSDLMRRFTDQLSEHPLNFMGLLIECCERLIDIMSQNDNLKVLQIARSLKSFLSHDMAIWLEGWGIPENQSERKIDSLFESYNSAAWGTKNCQELIGICKEYLEFTKDVERLTQCEVPKKLVKDAIHRVELHSQLISYLEKVITIQFTHQYNEFAQADTEATIEISKDSQRVAIASKKDSEVMKTISYLTLFFLPSTFVCAIFSTTIFNFQNWYKEPENSRVISKGWWVLVLSCVMVTIGTIGSWIVWRKIQRRLSKDEDSEKDIV